MSINSSRSVIETRIAARRNGRREFSERPRSDFREDYLDASRCRAVNCRQRVKRDAKRFEKMRKRERDFDECTRSLRSCHGDFKKRWRALFRVYFCPKRRFDARSQLSLFRRVGATRWRSYSFLLDRSPYTLRILNYTGYLVDTRLQKTSDVWSLHVNDRRVVCHRLGTLRYELSRRF